MRGVSLLSLTPGWCAQKSPRVLHVFMFCVINRKDEDSRDPLKIRLDPSEILQVVPLSSNIGVTPGGPHGSVYELSPID